MPAQPPQGTPATTTSSTSSATDPSSTTARSFTAFLLPPPMTFYVQLGNGLQLELTPSPERLLSSFLNAGATGVPLVPIVFTAPLGAGAAGGDADAMMRAMHELFMRSQSEQRGPPPTSKAFLANLPLKTWDAATCASEKYTDCAICLSEYETDDQVLSLPCGHAFHKDCGMPWLVEHNVCPTCRYQMPTQDADKPAVASSSSADTAASHAPADAAAATTSATDTDQQQTEETGEPEEEPAFERMLRTLLGVRRERSPTFAEPQPVRAVRQRTDAADAVILPGAVAPDDSDSDAALDSLLEEEASRFVEEENGKRLTTSASTDDDNDAAIFDAVDVDELLRDTRPTAT